MSPVSERSWSMEGHNVVICLTFLFSTGVNFVLFVSVRLFLYLLVLCCISQLRIVKCIGYSSPSASFLISSTTVSLKKENVCSGYFIYLFFFSILSLSLFPLSLPTSTICQITFTGHVLFMKTLKTFVNMPT